jgi:hypothetical protein
MPTLVERCVHQGINTGHHALFKEKWERCKNCAYDPENNKRCPEYSTTAYFGYGFEISNLTSSTQSKREDIRA